jgi:hypothetical protein
MADSFVAVFQVMAYTLLKLLPSFARQFFDGRYYVFDSLVGTKLDWSPFLKQTGDL